MNESSPTQPEPAPARQPESLPRIFVETTARVDLAIGSPETGGRLRALLGDYEPWGSPYVRMEVARTVGHAFEVVRSLALIAPSDAQVFPWMLREIERRRGLGRVRLSARQQARSRLATFAAMERLGSVPATRALVAGTASIASRLALDPGWSGIAHEVDETDCDLVQLSRRQGGRMPMTCNAKHAECRQQGFLERERARLEAVLRECEDDPDFDDDKLQSVLRTVLGGTPLHSLGQSRCWPLGDVILGLEAVSIGSVLSSNRKHFAPICRALGIDLVTYTP